METNGEKVPENEGEDSTRKAVCHCAREKGNFAMAKSHYTKNLASYVKDGYKRLMKLLYFIKSDVKPTTII